jgi:hypothetical protein
LVFFTSASSVKEKPNLEESLRLLDKERRRISKNVYHLFPPSRPHAAPKLRRRRTLKQPIPFNFPLILAFNRCNSRLPQGFKTEPSLERPSGRIKM